MKKKRSADFPLILYTVVLYVCPLIVILALKIIGLDIITPLFLIMIGFDNPNIGNFIYGIAPWQVSVALLVICFIVHMIAWIFNLLCASKRTIHKWGTRKSARFFKFKLIHAPYQILYFACFFMFFLAAANPFLMWTWLFVPLEILHAYIVLLATSFHGISLALRLKRAGIISNKRFVITVILLLTFVLDFIGGAMLAAADKKARKTEDINTNNMEVKNES